MAAGGAKAKAVWELVLVMPNSSTHTAHGCQPDEGCGRMSVQHRCASVTGRGFTPGNAIEGVYQGLTFSLVLVLLDEEEALGDGLWVC